MNMKRCKRWIIAAFLAALMVAFSVAGAAGEEDSDKEAKTAEAPKLSHEQGYYKTIIEVEITAARGSTIYYTVDGSVPTPGSASTRVYKEPVRFSPLCTDDLGQPKAHVLRCIAMDSEGNASEIVTATYFVGTEFEDLFSVPVWSLVTDENNLYNATTGIFKNYAKRGKAWERPVHVTYFVNKEAVLDMNAGMRVHGSASRGYRIKSMRLYARSEYDTNNKFSYPFFEDEGAIVGAYDENEEPIDGFKRLILRNGGSEGPSPDNTMFRDILTHYLMKNTEVAHQAGRPVVVYLNGTLYGFFNLQERIDDRFLKEHYDVESTDVAIYEYSYDSYGRMSCNVDADTDAIARDQVKWWNSVYQYITKNDLSDDSKFAKIEEAFDIDNLIDYYIMQIFSANEDWPGDNSKAWRYLGTPTDEFGKDGKLRYILYDTEDAWGMFGSSATRDIFKGLLSKGGRYHPYQDGATVLFRSLVKNQNFCRRFVSRFLDRLNTDFSPENLSVVVAWLAEEYKDLAPMQKSKLMTGTMSQGIELMTNYVQHRAKNIRNQLEQYFSFGGYRTLTVAFNGEAATLYVNGQAVSGDSPFYKDGVFTGIYAMDSPIECQLIINSPKYVFDAVEGDVTSEIMEWTIPAEIPEEINLEVKLTRLPDPTPTPTPLPTPTPSPAPTPKPTPLKAEKSPLGYIVLSLLGVSLIAGTVIIVRSRR
ncbi:MAG: CotH kinase family protein [Lachnospiraceae bacterium]|nr:CotH kinase family protein [Lachnospiraceae bacterium]